MKGFFISFGISVLVMVCSGGFVILMAEFPGFCDKLFKRSLPEKPPADPMMGVF